MFINKKTLWPWFRKELLYLGTKQYIFEVTYFLRVEVNSLKLLFFKANILLLILYWRNFYWKCILLQIIFRKRVEFEKLLRFLMLITMLLCNFNGKLLYRFMRINILRKVYVLRSNGGFLNLKLVKIEFFIGNLKNLRLNYILRLINALVINIF